MGNEGLTYGDNLTRNVGCCFVNLMTNTTRHQQNVSDMSERGQFLKIIDF